MNVVPMRRPAIDDAIKLLNEARDTARSASRLLLEHCPTEADQAEQLARGLNALSKRLWSA